MKSIELTEEHKSKLLEMCKNLFPEQEFYWEYEMYGRGLKEDFNDVLQVYFKDKEAWKRNLFPFNIHWFEFCFLHIFPKVQQIFNANQLSNFYYVTFGYTKKSNGNKDWGAERFIHPIDYLYEEFKKLK